MEKIRSERNFLYYRKVLIFGRVSLKNADIEEGLFMASLEAHTGGYRQRGDGIG
jgi:hypothetical protein